MRRVLRFLWPAVLATLPACAPPPAPAPGGDTLVLEVGGDLGSLRQALVAAGVETPSAAAVPPAIEPERDEPPRAGDTEEPPERAPSAPDHIMVELGRGETLIHLAKKHLGDGNRFRDILEANGWTENDARRLPAGQMVRVPLDPPSRR